MSINELCDQAYALAKEKGFHEKPIAATEKIMLVVCELSEAVEELRKGKTVTYYENGKPEGLPIELADAVIRIADLCGALGIDLEEAITVKQAYNKTRPYKHGKAF